MTVIAWDGETLAADKRAVSGGGIVRTVTKIERFGDELIGMTGNIDTCLEMRAWYKSGANGDFPRSAEKAESTLIVIRDGEILSYCAAPIPMKIEDCRAAFGSGRDFAEAAMYCGKSAEEAVKIACLFQSDCGNGVDVIQL